ncbi:MAG TPA: glycosyltransferase family 4 protein [Nocardioides sp.]|nr:glycosyltransferase family 4 protein [Nocardioides sp.]
MRIAFLSWRDTGHPDGGGSEEYIEHIAEQLVARGHDVTIRCAAYEGGPADEVRRGVRFVRRGHRLTVYPRGLAWAVLGCGRRCDVVVEVVNGIPFGLGLVRRRRTVPLVHHLHREQWRIIYPGWKGRTGWLIERATIRAYRGLSFLTVSRATADDLVAHGVPRAAVHVVRNGAERRPRQDVERSPLTLCTLSRLVPHKRIEQAVDVVVALAPRFPGLRLVVVGAGWWEPELRRYVAAAGADRLVHLVGRVDAEERDRVLASATAMLLPSVREGWGLAVVEAALQGTPTVAYRWAGGVAESVADQETGLLVDTPAGLETAVARLLTDQDLWTRLSAACRDRALTYKWEQAAADVEALLRDQVAGLP